MRFSTLVLKNLFRRRSRTLLTMLGVSIAVGAVVALVGVANGLESSFLQLYQGRGVDLIVVKAGVTERLSSALDESLEEKIARIPGVKFVTGGLLEVVSFEDLDLFAVVVQGWPDDSFMLRDLRVLNGGRTLRPGDRRVVLLGSILAKNMGKRLGDSVEIIEDEPFEVVGIYESFSVYENGAMIVPLAELQTLMDRPHQVTGFNLVLADKSPEAVEQVSEEVKKLGRGLEPMPTEDFVSNSSQLRVVGAMAWLTSAIALVIGAVGMLNTMVMSVFERTHEIGILRAIGWSRARIVRMVLFESVVLSVCGAIVGTLGAVLLTRLLRQLPQAAAMVASDFHAGVIGQGFFIALVVGLIGGVYPALRAASLLPTEALRHD